MNVAAAIVKAKTMNKEPIKTGENKNLIYFIKTDYIFKKKKNKTNKIHSITYVKHQLIILILMHNIAFII